MFTDYLGVMLLNLGAGLALLAYYLYVKPDRAYRRSWSAGFFAVGLLGFVTALPMILMWPLPGGYNVAFGEPALFLSVVFLAASITLALEWEPLIPAIYGFFGAIYSVVIGFRLMDLHLTSNPTVAGLAYILTGVGGLFTLPAIYWHKNRALSILTALILAVAALIWLYMGYDAVWGHIADFAKWLPNTMLMRAPK